MIELERIPLYFLRIVLVAFFIYGAYTHDFTLMFATILATAISFLPIILSKKYKINIPLILDYIVVLILAVNIIAYTFDLFSKFYFFSPILHFSGSALIALLAFAIAYSLALSKEIKLSPGMIAFFAVVFTIAIGTVWEILEFASDLWLGTHLQGDGINPLTDTMYDLIWDTVAGIVVAVIGTTTHILTSKNFTLPFNRIMKELGITKR